MEALQNAKKEVLIACLLFTLALFFGALAQVVLQVHAVRASQREADALVSSALSVLENAGQDVQDRREAAFTRMEHLPEEKRARLEALQLDLLMVVSASSPMPKGYMPKLEFVVGEYELDSRCAAACRKMIEDCRAEGWGLPMLCSAYRTQEYQEMLYTNKVIRVMEEEWKSYEDALVLAAQVVAVPGTSEHQTGLAADIMDEMYPYLNEWQETTAAQHWLMEHAPEYGFILRYPNGTSNITGIVYEPWHYRYVGEKFAWEITNRGITLEEYVAWRRGR